LGTSTNTIDISLTTSLPFSFLLSLLIAKLLMTVFALGLGIPGGIIGPTLAIGAIAGACAGALNNLVIPGVNLTGDFMLMGMAGFMAASLNAPLAALLAVVELSGQLELVVPAMLVITIASIVSRQVCNNSSIFTMQLDAQGLLYRKPPIEESLQNIGVLAVMKEPLLILNNASELTIMGELLTRNENQPVLNKVDTPINCPADYFWAQLDTGENNQCTTQLNETHPKQLILNKLLPINHQATLAEAYLALVEQRSGAVYIYQKDIDDCLGIVTFEQLRVFLVDGKLTI
jgi:hypothetical protein